MFGDEKTLSNVQHILAKQQQEAFSAGDLGAGGLDMFVQFVTETRDVITGSDVNIDNMDTATATICKVKNSSELDDKVKDTDVEECQQDTTDSEISFLELPIQVHLHILSFLNASDICKLSATCQQCQNICADQLIWRNVLNKEKTSWTELSNTSNPALYEDVNSDLSYKEIYMRCNPHCTRQEHFDVLSIPRLLWSFLPHKSPKVVMFGPGLDSNTSTLVRKFIGNESSTFQVRGVFPAEHPGSVGTGFHVSMNNKAQLRLITLYSGTKRDRTHANINAKRADRNKLLRPVSSAATDTDEDEIDLKYEPTPAVRDLCSTTDAFIFVVDASVPIETLPESRPELFAMLCERWTPGKAPLLVLSCVPDEDSSKIPCVDVAQQLAMHRINRTWKMFDATVSSLSGVVDGISWLLDAAQRR